MAEHQSTGERLGAVKDNASTVVSGVAELAGTQLKPSAKHAGIGAGMFGGAGGFAWMSLKFLVFALVFLLSWLYGKTGVSVLMAVFLGFITMFVVGLIIAGALAVLGSKQFKKVKGPKTAIEELKTTLAEVGAAAGTGAEYAKTGRPEPALEAGRTLTQATKPRAHYVVDPIVAAKKRAAERVAAKKRAAERVAAKVDA